MLATVARAFRIGLIAAAAAGLACAEAPDPSHTRRPPDGYSAQLEVRAPIVGVSARVAESYPPQYFADVTSALPDGCAQFARTALRRVGDTVFVDVFNTRPNRDDMACTMIYGERETAVALGSDFVPGTTYTLDVNGTRETFVAE